MAGGVTIRGSAELRKAIKATDKALAKELTKANRDVGRAVQRVAQSGAKSGTRQQAKAAPAIKARATQKSAGIGIRPTASIPFARGPFYGAKRYRQFMQGGGPNWVGNSWQVAKAGEGPMAINDALAHHEPELKGRYVRVMDDYLHTLAQATR